MNEKLPLNWETISLFVRSGISKYIYAFPGFIFFILTATTLSDKVLKIILSTDLLYSYLLFSIIYSVVGIIFYTFCPVDIRNSDGRRNYIASSLSTISDEDLGEIRLKLNEKASSSNRGVISRYYDFQNYSLFYVRLIITSFLALGIIPTAVASFRQLGKILLN